MAGGPIGGRGNLVQRTIWVFVSCCIVVAVWNTFPHDPRGFVDELQRRSEQVKGVAGDVKDWTGVDRLGETTSPGSGKPAKPARAEPKRRVPAAR